MDENKDWEKELNSFNPSAAFPDPTTPDEQVNASQTEKSAETQFVQAEQPEQNSVQNETPQYTNVKTYTYAKEQTVHKSKAAIFVALGVLLLAAVVAVIVFISSNSQNYEKAERAFVGEIFSAFDSVQSSNISETSEIVITPSEALAQLLGSDTLNPTTIATDMQSADGSMSGDVRIINGTKTVLTILEWVNSGKMILQVPELSSVYITTEAQNDSTSAEITPETLEKAVNSFLDKYFIIVKDAQTEKNVPVTSNGITLNCDVVTIPVDELIVEKLKLAVYETMLEYPELIDYFHDYYPEDISVETVTDEADIAKINIDELRTEENLEILGTLVCYMNGGKIVGRTYTSAENSTTSSYHAFKADNAYVTDFTYSEENNLTVSLVNNGTVSGDKYTGTIDLSLSTTDLDKVTVTIDYKEITVADNHYNGAFTMTIPAVAANVDGVFTYDGTSDNLSLDVFIGGTNYGTLTFNSKTTDTSVSAAPEIDDSNSISISTDAEMSGNSEQFNADIAAFVEDIKAKLADENGNYDIISAIVSDLGGLFTSLSSTDTSDNTDEASDNSENVQTELSEEEIAYYQEIVSALETYINDDGSFNFEAYCNDNDLDYSEYKDYEDYYTSYLTYIIEAYKGVLNGTYTLDELSGLLGDEEHDDFSEDDYSNDDYTSSEKFIDSSTIDISLNGKSYGLILPASEFTGIFPSIATDTLDSDDYGYSKYYSTDDYTISLNIYYYGENPPAVKDCYVTSYSCVSDANDKNYVISINGITIGSSEADLLATFGEASYSELSDYGNSYSYCSEDYNLYLYFSVYDGVVYSIDYSYNG